MAAKPLWEYCKKRRESLLGEDRGGTATTGSARRHKLHIGDHEIVNDGSYKAVTEGLNCKRRSWAGWWGAGGAQHLHVQRRRLVEHMAVGSGGATCALAIVTCSSPETTSGRLYAPAPAPWSDSGRPGRRFGKSDRLYEGLQGAQARGSEEEALGR